MVGATLSDPLSGLLDVLFAYLIAYTLWWMALVSRRQQYVQLACLLLVIYIIAGTLTTMQLLGFGLVLPGIAYGVKAFMTFNSFVCLYSHYKQSFRGAALL